MKRFAAQALSFVFNPAVILFFVPYLLLRETNAPEDYIHIWSGITSLFIASFALLMVYLVRRHIFTNLDVSQRKQRPLLFLLIGVITLLYLVMLIIFQGPRILFAGVFGVFLALVLISSINTHVKASIHIAAMCTFFFLMIILHGWIFIGFLPFIPLVAWARLYLRKHTMQEILVGALSGVLLTMILYILFKYQFHLGA